MQSGIAKKQQPVGPDLINFVVGSCCDTVLPGLRCSQEERQEVILMGREDTLKFDGICGEAACKERRCCERARSNKRVSRKS